MYKHHHDIQRFLQNSEPVALIEIEDAHGSTPRDVQTWMLVRKDQIFRTIGGGRLEAMAVEKARGLLEQGQNSQTTMHIPLGPHIGQCCGGTVNLRVNVLDPAGVQACIDRIKVEMDLLPNVYIFGAGHVGNALAQALSLLPVHCVLIDTREQELKMAPQGIKTRLSVLPEQDVRNAKADSAFVILTHDHALDFLIANEAIARNDAAYIGMIGSKTKRATFRNWLRRENGREDGIERLSCPIGNAHIHDKRPEIIAALATAEIITRLHEADSQRIQNNQHISFQQQSGISL